MSRKRKKPEDKIVNFTELRQKLETRVRELEDEMQDLEEKRDEAQQKLDDLDNLEMEVDDAISASEDF